MLEQKTFFYQYDTDATAYKYGRVLDPVPGPYGIATAGSNTTVTSVGGSGGAFDPVNVGDILWITLAEVVNIRKVTAKASNDSITINSAINIGTGGIASWRFLPFQIGTGATAGWHACQKYDEKLVKFELVSSADAGGLDISIEVKGFETASAPIQLISKHYATGSYTDPTAGETFVIPEIAAAVRFGVKGTSGFSATDNLSAYLIGKPRKP